MRKRTPACGSSEESRATTSRGSPEGGTSRKDAGVCVGPASAGAADARGCAVPSDRPSAGAPVSQSGVATRRTASSVASRAGAGARAVAPRSSQKGASVAALAGSASVHSTSRKLVKIAARRDLATMKRGTLDRPRPFGQATCTLRWRDRIDNDGSLHQADLSSVSCPRRSLCRRGKARQTPQLYGVRSSPWMPGTARRCWW